MANYKFVLQYEGTKYQGWQRQESTGNTIQGKLEAVLSKMVGDPIEIQGSGRTDAGVHARMQVANAHMNTELSCEEIRDYMNAYLPEDIGVVQVEMVAERFHSRLNAKEKTYTYSVINSAVPHVFERRYAHVVTERLDIEAMKLAAQLLCGTHDFKSFTSTKKGKKSTVRTIHSIEIRQEGDMVYFIYNGNGFLYHMVRILTGTLLEVGSGQRKAGDISDIIAACNREKAGALIPAKGLTLLEVRY